MVRTVGRLLLWMVIVFSPFALAAGMSRSFIYYPTKLSDADLTRLARAPKWQRWSVEVEPGLITQGLIHRPSHPKAPWLLFFGGNAMDLEASQSVLDLVGRDRDWGLAVLAYRGYDGSAGKPSETALMHDAQVAATTLLQQEGVLPDRLILMGQSLGTGVAAQLSVTLAEQNRAVAGIILVSAYTSLSRLADELMPLPLMGAFLMDTFHTDTLTPHLGSTLLIHGSNDDLVRIAHSQDLAAALGSRAKLVTIKGKGHNDIWLDPDAVTAARTYISDQTHPHPQ